MREFHLNLSCSFKFLKFKKHQKNVKSEKSNNLNHVFSKNTSISCQSCTMGQRIDNNQQIIISCW